MVTFRKILSILFTNPLKNPDPAIRWRNSLALIYAISSWFTVGSLIYITMRKPSESPKPESEILKDLAEMHEGGFTRVQTVNCYEVPERRKNTLFEKFETSTK